MSKGRLVEVLDKKTAAIAITGYTTFDKHTERRLFYNEVSFFITGAGDFGGKSLRSGNFSGALLPRQMPNTEPNCTLTYQTSEQQAALYRLTGDLEEVHIDPSASQNSGMGATPILHGACTLGIAGRHLLSSYGPYKKIRARFARPVIPGDKLKTEMWKCRKYVLFQVRLDKTGDICVKEGCVELCESAFKL